MSLRSIRKIVKGRNTQDGAGVKLVRVISDPDVREFDPFLLLDAFDSYNPADYTSGFPWHPHRGIETITYLISGEIKHEDSLGNKGTILDGCCQWMTAGGGILHQEMPQVSKRMLGIQLWLNLPAKNKMTAPQYREITPDMVPTVNEDGIIIKVVSEHYRGIPGAVKSDFVKLTLLDVTLNAGANWEYNLSKEHTLFVYIVEGAGWFEASDHPLISCKSAVLFNQGEEFLARASDQGMRFLLFAGEPIGEPISWGGPIVMNTQAELKQAFRDLEEGTFVLNFLPNLKN